jgi:hypothetical protein
MASPSFTCSTWTPKRRKTRSTSCRGAKEGCDHQMRVAAWEGREGTQAAVIGCRGRAVTGALPPSATAGGPDREGCAEGRGRRMAAGMREAAKRGCGHRD